MPADKPKRRRILCIEDDREFARLIAEELVDYGFDARIAFDGYEGFAAIEQQRPDLVLCDICMPGLSGIEVLRRAKALGSLFEQTHFLFVTALSEFDKELEGQEFRPENYIVKPINFDGLVTTIKAKLETDAEQWPIPGAAIRESHLGLSPEAVRPKALAAALHILGQGENAVTRIVPAGVACRCEREAIRRAETTH